MIEISLRVSWRKIYPFSHTKSKNHMLFLKCANWLTHCLRVSGWDRFPIKRFQIFLENYKKSKNSKKWIFCFVDINTVRVNEMTNLINCERNNTINWIQMFKKKKIFLLNESIVFVKHCTSNISHYIVINYY